MPATAQKVHAYSDTREAWDEFMQAMHSGEQFECDAEMYYYWLEVLPPRYFKEPVTWPDGQTVKPKFGFVEGADYITAFWMTGKERIEERPAGGVICTLHRVGEPGARYFGRRTNIMARG
jgi:hypothetical protein